MPMTDMQLMSMHFGEYKVEITDIDDHKGILIEHLAMEPKMSDIFK